MTLEEPCARIRLVEGDITRMEVDAIVNAANPSLMGGGGVDGAIHRAAGPELREECQKIRETQYPDGLPTGEAVITGGYRLPARHVIHTVGPIWRGGSAGEDDLLARAYRSSLELARDHRLNSVAFPSISTGAYGFPIERAARIALRTIHAFLKENAHPQIVYMVLFGKRAFQVYQEAWKEICGESVES